MSWKRWICGALLTAAPVLLWTQCSTNGSQPTAPAAKSALAATGVADARGFEVLSPAATGTLCAGQCTRVTWRVDNPSGDYTVYVGGWYDGVFVYLGSVTNESWLHWDTPGGPHAALPAQSTVTLRVIVMDDLGFIGTQDLNLGPIAPAPPAPRPPGEFD